MTLVNTDFFFKNAVTRHSNNRSELYGIARSIMAGSKRQLLEMMKNKKRLLCELDTIHNTHFYNEREMNESLISCNAEYLIYLFKSFYRILSLCRAQAVHCS